MDKALNEVLGSLPDDTKVYVCRSTTLAGADRNSPGTSTPKTMPSSPCQFIRIKHFRIC
jgi:hypothetical protein